MNPRTLKMIELALQMDRTIDTAERARIIRLVTSAEALCGTGCHPVLRERVTAFAVDVNVQQTAMPVQFASDRLNGRLGPLPPQRRADERVAAPRTADEEALHLRLLAGGILTSFRKTTSPLRNAAFMHRISFHP